MAIKSYQHILKLCASALMLVALTACGGGGGGGGAASGPSAKVVPDTGKDSTTGYTPPSDETAPEGGWKAALAAARNAEYGRSQSGANRIGASYAHVRGFTGAIVGSMPGESDVGGDHASVIISHMGRAVGLDNEDLNQRIIPGYSATEDATGIQKGICSADIATLTCGLDDQIDSHLAGIMIGEKGNCTPRCGVAGATVNAGIQGIAYNARLKPIDIVTDDIYKAADATTRGQLVAAIGEGSGETDSGACTTLKATDVTDSTTTAVGSRDCRVIAVMNNGWGFSAGATYDEMVTITSGAATHTYHYKEPSEVAIHADEKAAWVAAVGTGATGTVVVFAHGDEGHNSFNWYSPAL